MYERKRLFLRMGDEVTHLKFPEWGIGIVVEDMRSDQPGGICFVRVDFEDGLQRTFDNDFDSEWCCYFFGIRRQ